MLDDQPGPARDIVILNAGVALYAANVVDSMKAGIDKARSAITSGEARARLDGFVALSRSLEGVV